MRTEGFIQEAISLTLNERALLLDSLLQSLNAPKPEVDRQWADGAIRRLAELRSGEVRALPGEDVFSRLLTRL